MSPSPLQPAARRARTPAKNWNRPAHPADLAQARLFEDILQAEISELEGIVGAAEEKWRRRCERHRHDDQAPPDALIGLSKRLDEARCALRALRIRFLDELDVEPA